MRRSNRYIEAFKESFNAVGLATAVALSAATLNPLPLLAGLVLEAAYLLFVPDSKWYEARLSQRYDKEVNERRQKLREQVFPVLSATVQDRFIRLEALREQINGQTFEGRKWFREILRKLDYLLEKFLLFASKQVEFENYLVSVLDDVRKPDVLPPPRAFRDDDERRQKPKRRRAPESTILGSYDNWVRDTVASIHESYSRDMEQIDGVLQKDENLHNQAVLEKRKEVLTRRQEYVARIGEILVNLSHQLHLMEDTFGLINDEIRARSPEQVLADIEDVVYQTDTLTETLQEVAPFDEMPLAPGAGRLFDVEEKRR